MVLMECIEAFGFLICIFTKIWIFLIKGKKCHHLGRKSSIYSLIALLKKSTRVSHQINNYTIFLFYIFYTIFYEVGAYSHLLIKVLRTRGAK